MWCVHLLLLLFLLTSVTLVPESQSVFLLPCILSSIHSLILLLFLLFLSCPLFFTMGSTTTDSTGTTIDWNVLRCVIIVISRSSRMEKGSQKICFQTSGGKSLLKAQTDDSDVDDDVLENHELNIRLNEYVLCVDRLLQSIRLSFSFCIFSLRRERIFVQLTFC